MQAMFSCSHVRAILLSPPFLNYIVGNRERELDNRSFTRYPSHVPGKRTSHRRDIFHHNTSTTPSIFFLSPESTRTNVLSIRIISESDMIVTFMTVRNLRSKWIKGIRCRVGFEVGFGCNTQLLLVTQHVVSLFFQENPLKSRSYHLTISCPLEFSREKSLDNRPSDLLWGKSSH